ncbi:MAG: dienelactone hydrolase family protein [Pseudomonadota bacterium]
MKTTTRIKLKLREIQSAALALLAALALTACGGGANEESPHAAAAEAAEVQVAAQIVPGVVSMTKVSFTNSEGQALTGFMFKDSSATPKNAAVVMMHGCGGIWSNGVISTDAQPAITKLSHIHRRWGENLARAGYVGLLVDSFTSRSLTNECDNGAAGLNEATKRPKDALAGREWLVSNSHVTGTRVALMGWSNGGSAVMATMDKSNEGTVGARPFKEAFSFYPGCGLISEFGGDATTPAKTTWLPYAPVTIHHGSMDPLYTVGRCTNRVDVATTLGARAATGNAVAMTTYTGARHSFDQIDISKTIASPYTSADKDAQEAADASVMARLAAIFGS